MILENPIFWTNSILQPASSPASAERRPGCGWLGLFLFLPRVSLVPSAQAPSVSPAEARLFLPRIRNTRHLLAMFSGTPGQSHGNVLPYPKKVLPNGRSKGNIAQHPLALPLFNITGSSPFQNLAAYYLSTVSPFLFVCSFNKYPHYYLSVLMSL